MPLLSRALIISGLITLSLALLMSGEAWAANGAYARLHATQFKDEPPVVETGV